MVPVFNAVVNVTGAVNSPVAVTYVPGADMAERKSLLSSWPPPGAGIRRWQIIEQWHNNALCVA